MNSPRVFLMCLAAAVAGTGAASAQTAPPAAPGAAQPASPPSGATSAPAGSQPNAAPQAAKPDAGTPDVATILFTGSQWAKAPAGTVLTYSYSRKTNVKEFGKSFDDKLVLHVDKGDSEANRTVAVNMFSGENRQPAGPFENAEQNPVLLLTMEENVQEMSRAFKANPLFFKKAIRTAWRDKAKIERASFELDGKSVAGTIITVRPFVGNAEADRMLGLEDLTYTVKVSPDVPGYIGEIDITTPPDSKAQFSEVLRYGEKKQP